MKKEKLLKLNKETILSVGFLGVLTAFLLLCAVLPDREFSEAENRNLAEFPETNLASVADGRFMEGFEAYSSDSVAGRDGWVKLKNSVDKLLGKNDNGQAYWGDNGYLFPIEDVDLNRLTNNLNYIEDFLTRAETEHGVTAAYVMPVPTSQEILSEYLPENAKKANQAAVIEQTREKFLNSQTAEFIDAGKALENHKNEYIYYKTDHHWTTLGAYYGYRAWTEAADVKPLEMGELEQEQIADDFYGTTYSKIASFGVSSDYIVKMSNEQIEAVQAEFWNALGEAESQGDLFDESYLKTKDKYSYFLSSNHPMVKLGHYREDESKNGNEKKLLIIKDSYANCFVPFLTGHYDEIYVADLRYYKKSLMKLIEENDINEVLVMYNAVQFANDPNFVFLKAD